MTLLTAAEAARTLRLSQRTLERLRVSGLPLLQMAYRGQVQLTPQQMRAAIEALPFEVPKLSATAITSMDEKSFAAQLERCIERSRSPVPMLNGPTIDHEELVTADEMKKPFQNYRRF
jgi:hypothetical protein